MQVMIVILTHARGHSDEDLMFARLWNTTPAKFDRLADLSDEDRLLLSCHFVVVVILALLRFSSGSWPSSRLVAQPVHILIQRSQRYSHAALHHYPPSRIRSSFQISIGQAAKTRRLCDGRDGLYSAYKVVEEVLD